MEKISDNDKIELCVLSHLTSHAEQAKKLVEVAQISEDDFASQAHKDAFSQLVREGNDDPKYRIIELLKTLPQLKDTVFIDYFNGLAPATTTITSDFRDLISLTYDRDCDAAMIDIQSRRLEPEVKNDAIKAATEAAMQRYEQRRNELSTVLFETPPATAPARDSRYAIDESLLNVPGFINQLVDFTLKTAPRPNRVLAFAGALTFLAHLAGRKFYGPRDAFPNIYIVALAESGAGKDHPRKVTKFLSDKVHIGSSVMQSFASGQGLEDALADMPTLLCQFDEFDSVLREIKNDRVGSSNTESLWRTLLNVYTSSGSTINTRRRAKGQNKSPGGDEIHYPSFSIFATAIPSNFYGALSQRALTGGLLGRFLVIEAGVRGDDNQRSGLQDRPVPLAIEGALTRLADMPPQFNDRMVPSPRKVDYADDAASEAVRKVGEEADALYHQEGAGEMERSVWNRSVEHVLKLALLYALSGSLDNPKITVEGIEWAWRLVKGLQERMILMAHDYVAVDQMDEAVLAVLRKVREAGKKGITRSKVTKDLHVTSFKMDEIERTLEERDEIAVISPPNTTKKTKLYRIKGKAKK